MVDKTFVDFISEKKKLKNKILDLERKKLRMKQNIDLKMEKEYRKKIDIKLSKELIDVAQNSPSSDVWHWGTKLKSLFK